MSTLLLLSTIVISTAAPLAERAVSPDDRVAREAIAALRAAGPPGLATLLETHAEPIAAYDAWLAAPGTTPPDPLWRRLSRALDAVGGQCDNHAARLFWHTDLDRARAEARRTGRPILSLRLLGRLDEDLSCANSRFLRTAVYANDEIGRMLRQRFVLHWKSVRPVPRITIDFGDGRSIVRTVTGNSLHYVLDAEGRPLDALPGLYGPGAFRDWLERMDRLHVELGRLEPDARAQRLRQHHQRRLEGLVAGWRRDLLAVGAEGDIPPGPQAAGVLPDALAAAPVAVTKAAVELPMLRAMRDSATLERATGDDAWEKIAALRIGRARLDEASRALMHAKTRVTPAMIERFERAMALDTVRNEYLLHRRIHEWLAAPRAPELETMTTRIYDELFLTPDEDPWLGLLARDTYAALDGNGVRSGPRAGSGAP